ncbi:MAG TPA: hypothetical protein VF345_08345 [Chthoniobacterales bacterium]
MSFVEKDVWLQWAPAETNEKVRYWVDRWQELVDNFNVNSYWLRLSSPHLLVLAIADEIEHNDLRNVETRKVFQKELGRILRDDLVVRNALTVEFGALIKNFDKPALLHLNTLCASVQPFFTSGDYFVQSVARLIAILLNDTWSQNDPVEIGRLSNSLIIEFLQASYHITTIRSIPAALFDKLRFRPDGSPDTRFLHSVDWRSFLINGKYDPAAHSAAIAKAMADLSPRRRLETLVDVFRRPMELGTIIFPVSGVRNVSKLELNAVTLYNPATHPLLENSEHSLDKNPELFRRPPDLPLVNAAVRLSFRDAVAGADVAADMAEEAFDWIRPHSYSKYPIEVDRRNHIALDRAGRLQRAAHGISLNTLQLAATGDGIDLQNLVAHLPNGLIDATLSRLKTSGMDHPIVSKLRVCFRWYRRAVEAQKPEDKLLNAWIVLERMFAFSRHDALRQWGLGSGETASKFRIIAEYIPVRDALQLMYDFGWQLYYYLRTRLPELGLSAALLKRSGLETSQPSITFDQFIPSLGEIRDQLTNRIISEKVHEAYRFYHDGKVAREQILKRHDSTRNEVVLIYRLRNTIVHHGHFDRTVLIQLAARAVQLAANATILLFGEFLRDPKATVETIFAAAKVEYDRTIARLDQNLPVNFESFKPWGTYPRVDPPTNTAPVQ